MYERDDKDRQSDYLLMLIWHTVFFFMFAVITFMLDWDKTILVFVTAINIACWILHFISNVSEKYKTWLFFLEGMIMFFFYGQHATSLWDMTAVYIFILFLYYRNRIKRMITICMVVYYFTLACNFLFESRFNFEILPINIARLVLHCTLVYASAWMAKSFITKDLRFTADLDREIYLLEEMNNRTIDFLSNVSHELRTPINVITGTSAVRLKTERDPERRRSIIFVQDAGKKLFSLVDEILDYAEVSSEKTILFEDEYVFLSLVNDVVIENRAIPINGNVELIFDVDASIPSVLSGDSRKIKKVLHLLIDNAIKFTSLGAVYVKIRALPKSYGINLCIEVRDTGKGIEEENIAKIASRFYQGNSGRNRSTGGLGLGLSIAYGLVSAMKGFIRVESEPGRGTTFTMSIPQHVVDSSPAITFSQQSKVVLGLFIRTEKYSLPEVKFFYNETILHMVRSLEVPLHRVFDLAEAKRLVEMYQFTHFFVGREEFDEDREYFESLSLKTNVIVIADATFSLPPESGLKILHKPIWVLPVMNAISAGSAADIFSDKKTRIICPDVKILVVDDEPMNLMITEGLLKDYQMKVFLAESGKKAIEMCESDTFDIIFLDHMMPEMDGVETMRRLKMIASKSGKALRVVAFTANVISSAREMFIKEGFIEFLSKPVEIAELERVLRKVLPASMITYVEDDSDFETLDAPAPAKAPVPAAQQEASQSTAPVAAHPADGLELFESAGINADAGLGYCRGDKSFYRELLLKFADDAPEKMEKIEGFYESRDWDNYRILVHALKSTAKMIGADSLSEAARALEDASKNKDGAFIEEHHAEAMRQYAETTGAISAALGEGGGAESSNAEKPDAAASAIEISKEDFVQRLNELKGCFATFEADKAPELIDSMAGMSFGGKPLAAMLKGARQDIDNFDFSAAQEKLDALILGAEGGS